MLAHKTKRKKCVFIMAGGTGGHVFPGLALAKALLARDVAVFWLGTADRIEAELIPRENIPFYTLPIKGLRGKKITKLFSAPFALGGSLLKALWIFHKIKPAMVVGMGGFASGPGGLAAWLLRIPLIVHEQNAIAGVTNRILSKLAKQTYAAFPNTFKQNRDAIYCGNPVRENLLRISAPAMRYDMRKGPIRLLVLGGSAGALIFNQTVPEAVKNMSAKHRPLIWHQTGKKTYEDTCIAYEAAQVPARVTPFIDDMLAAYTWADLVLCRAGALTVFELMAVGLPAILVPYPYAVDDHQTVNAQLLVNSGAGMLVFQQQFTPAYCQEILGQLSDRSQLQTMAQAAYALEKPQATEKLMAACVSACEHIHE